MTKQEKIQELVERFLNDRIDDYRMFYEDVNKNRRNGIYELKHGNLLMDHFNNIMGNVEERLLGPLFPERFVNIDKFLEFSRGFKILLMKADHLFELNKAADSYIVRDLYEITHDLMDFCDVMETVDEEDKLIPYHEMRMSLQTKDLGIFFKIIKSLLASVSYAISKSKEGYLHSNIYLLVKILGFDILAEQTTNIGRIDCVIRFQKIIYIMEFKLGNAQEAIDQIYNNRYYEMYLVEHKEIIIVGVAFTKKNIADFLYEPLNLARVS